MTKKLGRLLTDLIYLCRDWNKGVIENESEFVEKLEKLNSEIREEVEKSKESESVEID